MRDRAGRRPFAAAVAAAVLALAGCADPAGPATGVPTGAPTEEGGDVEEPLLEIRRAGGLMPFGWDFATVSELTVYPDGRAVVHGPQIAVYPPPALPNLLVVHLDAADVDALVEAARDAALLGDDAPDYGRPRVADAPTTYVTLRVDGRTHAHAAEALGLHDGAGGDATPGQPPPDDGFPPGLTPEHRRARAGLTAFVTRAHELVGGAGEGQPYAIGAFAVLARPMSGTVPPDVDVAPTQGDGDPALEDDVPRPVLRWPLDLPLADAYDCLAVRGDDARVLRDALASESSTVLLEQDDVRYDAAFRPLLPHQDDCGDL